MEYFEEAAPMTKLLNKTRKQNKEFENFFDFDDPLAISDSVSMDFTKVVEDFTENIQDNFMEEEQKNNLNQKIGYKSCDICGLQYNSTQFKLHISKCQKYFHQFVEAIHSLIRGVLIQSCSAEAKNFTKCVFYHAQFSGIIQNIAYHRAIFTLFVYVDYYQNNQFY